MRRTGAGANSVNSSHETPTQMPARQQVKSDERLEPQSAARLAVTSAKAKLLHWADEHDARRRGPWRVMGTLAAGAAIVVIARSVLRKPSAPKHGARASRSLIGRAARPIARLVVAGRVAHWVWTRFAGRSNERRSASEHRSPDAGRPVGRANGAKSTSINDGVVPRSIGRARSNTRSIQ